MAADPVRFPTATAPHSPPRLAVPAMMRRVLYALVPAALCHVFFFGWGLLFNFAIAAIAALLAEATMLRLRGRTTREALRDNSALLTAALLSFAIPPLTPWWVPAIGSACAIVL